jgi:hypothetical protein
VVALIAYKPTIPLLTLVGAAARKLSPQPVPISEQVRYEWLFTAVWYVAQSEPTSLGFDEQCAFGLLW